jgi:Reverse transcriptase (RNA-dependent DNA polymerase)
VELELEINGRKNSTQLLMTGLGKERIILGFPWLTEHNPNINWKTGEFSWREPAKRRFFKNLPRRMNTRKLEMKYPKPFVEEISDEDQGKNRTTNPTLDHETALLISYLEEMEEEHSIWLNAKTTTSNEFHVKHDEKKPELSVEEQIPSEYHEFLDVFDEEKANRFPDSRIWDHKIEMKPGFEPKSFKTYNLTPEEQIELDNFLKDNLDKGYIRPSQSPMASPFFFVTKKDGKLRPCQDYRYLNDWTIKNAYPLPLISEIMDKLKGAKYFTKLDVRWGYNNIRIRKGDEWKAAFKTNKGLFEPTVMFFGMCNSPATFQAMMDNAFSDMIDEGIIIIYMDDILIFAKDKKTLEGNTKRVLARLQENNLFLKPKKCEFCKEKIEYLGMVIEEGKVSMDPGKLKGIKEWPAPTTVKQVRAFLGFGNFYRRFIRKFSDIARPLNDLLKKDKAFEWTAECQQSFDELKQ